MKYLVDTDWIIDYLTGQPPAKALFTQLLPEGVAISVISFSEVYEGIYGSRDPERAEQAFRAFLSQVKVLGINRSVAKCNGRIRNELRRQRHPITQRALDLLIAATSLEYNLILVTRNRDDYHDISHLQLYQPR